MGCSDFTFIPADISSAGRSSTQTFAHCSALRVSPKPFERNGKAVKNGGKKLSEEKRKKIRRLFGSGAKKLWVSCLMCNAQYLTSLPRFGMLRVATICFVHCSLPEFHGRGINFFAADITLNGLCRCWTIPWMQICIRMLSKWPCLG